MTNYVFQDARVETLSYNDRFSIRDSALLGRSIMRFVKVEFVPNDRGGNTNRIHANHATLGRITFDHNPHKMIRKVR